MSSNDPVTEWRQRWQSGSYAPVVRQPKPPRSPWVYALAAFVCIGVSCVGIMIAIGMSIAESDVPEGTIGYRNDTDEPVWKYACAERCDVILWSHYLQPDDWSYFFPEWYADEPIDWMIVTHEVDFYECLQVAVTGGELIELSNAGALPV